jgi:hypothetical protein
MQKQADLAAALAACAAQARAGQLAVGQVLDRLGSASYALVCIVLSLPFLQPVPIWPLSMLGGATFVALGWQLASGQPAPAAPERIRTLALPERVWRSLLGVWQWIDRVCRRVTRPRFSRWVGGADGSCAARW